MKPPEPHTTKEPQYSVSVYWPSERKYGGVTKACSWGDALILAEALRGMGFENPGRSEVHILRNSTDIWNFNQLTDCRAKLAAKE